jgi:uncharacterized membrane protein YdjX (TVP38/TMEM64 family)
MGRYRQLILVLAFLCVLLIVAEVFGLRDHFSVKLLHQRLIDNPVSGLALFVLLFALGNLIQIPGWIFLAAAVLAFGRTWGGLATYCAATISCAITFSTVRLIGGDAIRQLKSGLATRLINRLDAHPIRNVVILRTIFQTLAALNYALALSGVRFRDYMTGTLIGLPLPIAAYCLLFDYVFDLTHIT